MNTSDCAVDTCAIEERYLAVKQKVWQAAESCGRDPVGVSLVVVSKTFDALAIEPVLQQGHRVFGENRVQEAMGKWPALRDAYPGLELHLIGPLQTNKVREAVQTFDAIQTVDRSKLAAALAAEMGKQGRRLKLYVQVNIGNESQKAGVSPDDASAFVEECRSVHGLSIAGLMAIPPVEDDPIPYFRRLAEMAKQNGVAELSMGMSGDFEAAIAAGATIVRVGSAIFGSR